LDITTFGAAGPQTTASVPLPVNLFRVTMVLANGFTSGSSTLTFTGTSASGAACVPSPGSPCFTDQTLVVMVTAAPPPALKSAVSRKVHAGAGTFDLPLSLQPTAPTVEPRISGAGGAHTIVFVFDQALVSGQAAVTEGIATMGTPTFSGNEMRVPLSAVN